ncbi:MAG: 4'-phosphopantetheinyl transferase superfamily protein [Clostridia bacterium]|nr:4'-phosphopantetheinyl transferase superfamily protein [Clostridia bacterium]
MKNIKIYSYKKTDTQNSDKEILKSVSEYLKKTQETKFPTTIPNSEFRIPNCILRDSFGKPEIVGVDGIYVSVTHDKDLCLVAVAPFPVGIDMERVERCVKNPLALAKRYFCEDEVAFLGENPTNAEFTDMWVKKEALSKLIGRGVPAMREKSVFSEDVVFEKTDGFDGYIVYCVQYK